MHIIGEVYAQSLSTPYSPQSLADSIFAFKVVWFTVGAAFLTFFALCYFRVRSMMLALRYSVWLFVAGAFLYSAVAYTSFGNSQTSQADASASPHNVQILPLNSTQAKVTWATDKPFIEYVIYTKPDGTEQLVFDDTTPNPTMSHSVTISNLQINTHYPFKIRYNDLDFSQADGRKLDIFLP